MQGRYFLVGAMFVCGGRAQDALPAPGFHHLHLNSADPDRAIEFYTQRFPSTSRSSFAGLPALKSGKALILFTKVNAPAPIQPQTAIWHFGFQVTDLRKNLEAFRNSGVKLLPLYTSEEGGEVFINSDTYPGTGGTLGRTKAQLAEAQAAGMKPAGGGGFAYLQGPDGAIVEYLGNQPAERFNHVHMYQEEPFCAQLWYQKHLNAKTNGRGPQHTEADCKADRAERSWPSLKKEGDIRIPSAAVLFDDISVQWYARQGDRPLVSTRGHLADHFALSVADLDAWVAKLRGEGVRILEQPYRIGETRAVMIEGPSLEAIELIEVK
jgi:catechol 2,3-dioxygenase-like lactoylglutathione lyase family enzyme